MSKIPKVVFQRLAAAVRGERGRAVLAMTVVGAVMLAAANDSPHPWIDRG